MYHPPGIGHHVEEYPDGYFKVSSGTAGEVRIDAAPPTGALPLPTDDTDGFGHVLRSNFYPITPYDPIVDEPPSPPVGFWGMLEDGFGGGGDDGG
jgi:hypothetical protein